MNSFKSKQFDKLKQTHQTHPNEVIEHRMPKIDYFVKKNIKFP